MKDELKSKFFLNLASSEFFQAQVTLEDEIGQSLLSKMLNIDLAKKDVELEYAMLRGSLDVLKQIKSAREHLTQQARSRSHNS
jgi:hypothetical protein